MRIDDFVCLGRTVPEESKKYGRRVCMAGYSEELRSLVRVYPLPVINPIHQRDVCRLELSRAIHDNRVESWRLTRERMDDGIVDVIGRKETDEVTAWLQGKINPSINALNRERKSLGIIRGRNVRPIFRRYEEVVNPDQRLLFQDLADSFDGWMPRMAPYIRFEDEEGGHELQIREWGCYEWLRKEPGKSSQLWDNLRLLQPCTDYLFVIGNMCHQRTAWLIINVFRVARERTLFEVANSAAV